MTDTMKRKGMFTTRQEAKANNEKHYFTGKPCKNGHIAKRAVISGTCIECTAKAVKGWARNNKEKMQGYSQKYRDANREKVREKDRIAHAKYRRENAEKHKKYKRQLYAANAQKMGKIVWPRNRMPLTEFQERLRDIHQERLVCVEDFSGILKKAKFLCTEHNETFLAIPNNVLQGANPCSKCNHMRSAGEDEVARYLAIFTKVKRRDRKIVHPKEIDIVLDDDKLAIEYCGMYWHSHSSKEDEKKNKHKHFHKHKACKEKGIRLLTIYEWEWQRRKPAIKRLLRNAISKSKGKLMARKCEIRKVSNGDAKAFYERYHPQGGEGQGEHYALVWKGKMVACMRFTYGVNDRGAGAKNRVWTLSRYATRITVAGGASRLFKAFVKDKNPDVVKSFSDNRYFDGGMYKQLGFVLEEELMPDYQVWSPKMGLSPKPHYQRRQLPKRLKEHGIDISFEPESDPRTEADITYLMGARRLYDCGKKTWLFKKGV